MPWVILGRWLESFSMPHTHIYYALSLLSSCPAHTHLFCMYLMWWKYLSTPTFSLSHFFYLCHPVGYCLRKETSFFWTEKLHWVGLVYPALDPWKKLAPANFTTLHHRATENSLLPLACTRLSLQLGFCTPPHYICTCVGLSGIGLGLTFLYFFLVIKIFRHYFSAQTTQASPGSYLCTTLYLKQTSGTLAWHGGSLWRCTPTCFSTK